MPRDMSNQPEPIKDRNFTDCKPGCNRIQPINFNSRYILETVLTIPFFERCRRRLSRYYNSPAATIRGRAEGLLVRGRAEGLLVRESFSLLNNVGYDSSTNRATTFTDRESQAVVHRDWTDQFNI